MADDRDDSYLPNYFGIEIEGIECGKFTRCEGLESENYVYEVEEGGLNTTTHKFLGRTRFPNLVLEKGLTDNNEIYSWYHNTVETEDAVVRKDGSVILFNAAGEEVKRWNFFRALPCRWVGPQLGQTVHGCAVERIEIMHEGLEEAE
jgi:phage tail-like protein